MKLQTISFRTIFLATPFLLCAGAGHACEGNDLEITNRMYQHMVFVTQTCNEAGSVQDSLACLEQEWGYTMQHMSKLPESCQEMLEEFDPQS